MPACGVGYLLAGRMGILLFQAALAALTCLLLYRYTSAFFHSRATGIFAWLVFILATAPGLCRGKCFLQPSPPFWLWGFSLLTQMSGGNQQNHPLLMATLLGVVGYVLPWLHSKYALLAPQL
jgi:hypothetical protein